MSKAAVMVGPTEQAYYSASAENALLDREAIERRIADAVADGEASNDLLRKATAASCRLVTSRP